MKPLAALVLLVMLMAGVGAASANIEGENSMMLASDGAFSWWIHPLAVEDSADRQWVGYIDADGRVFVSIDGSPAQIDHVEADDHNAPAIAVHRTDPNRPALVFNATHAKDRLLRYRTVTPGGVVGPTQTLDVPGSATYAQALVGSGDRVVVLTRSTGCRWYAFITNNWGDTWSAPLLFMDACDDGRQAYLATTEKQGHSNIYRIAAYGHPVNSEWRSVQYGYINVDSGKILTPGGNLVARLSGDGLPIKNGDLMPVYEPPEGSRVRLLDVGDVDGAPTVVMAEWINIGDEDDQHGPIRYVTSRWDGSKFAAVDVGRYAGEPFWARSRYVRGAGLSNDSGLYTTSEEHGLERWSWGGHVWKNPVVIDPSPDAARPYAFRGQGASGLVWQNLNDYGPNFTHYDISLFTGSLEVE